MDRTCPHCQSAFKITEEDLAFYEKISPVFNGKKELVPPPTKCPDCRQQRRLMWRNERKLYQRKCDLTGKQIISIYAPERPYVVYGLDAWFSDQWDALATGRSYDPTKSFFIQFDDLLKTTPLLSLLIGQSENCDYTNFAYGNKNCYMIAASDFNEDCYFGSYLFRSRRCVDCLFVTDCELCSHCTDCEGCTRTHFSQNLKNCHDCWFMGSCLGCSDCIGCTNLRQEKHCILNKQFTQEEYERRKAELLAKLGSSQRLLEDLVASSNRSQPHCAAHNINTEGSSGNNLVNCKNCVHCFDLIESTDCRYVSQGIKATDCMDVNGVPESTLLYECAAVPTVSSSAFCAATWVQSSRLLYCYLCRACSDCFGCVSLHRKQYCILNKQYTKEEYEILVPKIIERMRKNGEWGEFFPMEISPFAYNETAAQDYFPLTSEEAAQHKWQWYEDGDPKDQYFGPPYEIPDSIADVPDDITMKILRCEVTGKPYKIIPQELNFYRQMHLPVPRKCPDQRHKERLALRNPRKLWDRQCAECGKGIETTYSPKRAEQIYCDDCYLKAVY
ncbi:MAG: hypothetical protein PHZ00_04215 [Candidatus Peribacteraceae bacterium]|nr:hypothetical protein [Candidatus Peribacteraceae bacterium]